MATILLPALRRQGVNLIPYSLAGAIYATPTSSTYFGGPAAGILALRDIGLKVGDVVSASAMIATTGDPEQQVRLAVRFVDSGGSTVSEAVSDTRTLDEPEEFEVSGATIPQGAAAVIIIAARFGALLGGTMIWRAMLNRGPTVAPHEWPRTGAWAPITHGQLVRDNEQFVQRYLSGASQITTFPSRRWLLQFATHILEGDELREWSLALDRLSDLTNVFHFVPPEYTGPSTGYEGPLPVVNGVGQLGTSLDCDGVTPETDIVGPGDYVSFPVTTSAGQTNYELHRISSLCTSDESGEVTLAFTRPIRLAPANDAVVQIYSPIGQFRLAVPRAGQDIQLLRRASVSVEAEEAIWL